MSKGLGYRYQQVCLRISSKGERLYFNLQSDPGYHKLVGMCLSVGNASALTGSTFGFRVDEKKVLEECHEAHLLVFSPDLSPRERMLRFDPAISVTCSRIEGIYTDSALQSLLDSSIHQRVDGIIPVSSVNVQKTYVSGMEQLSYANPVMTATGSAVLTGGPGTITAPSVSLLYPYDVKVYFLLTR